MSNLNVKDVSPEVLKKVVRDAAVAHPIVLSGLGLGITGGAVCFIFSGFLFSMALLAGGLVISGAAFSINYWGRRGTFEQQYIDDLNNKAAQKQKTKIKEFKKDLEFCLNFSNNDKFVKQAVKQFQTINDKFVAFQKLLPKKFDPNELTYARFYTTAEQTCGAVMDNLESVVLSFIALKDVDIDYLEERYIELKKQIDDGKAEKFDVEEFQAIQGRIDLRERKFYEIDQILSKNEKAITELDNLSFKLSSTKTFEGRAKQDLEKTLEELVNLNNSVYKYKV